MATFHVTQRTARPFLYEPGDKFVVPDEQVHQHCDSVALVPADAETLQAILDYAPESKAAKKIASDREAEKKKAQKDADIKKKTAEIAARQAAEAAAALKSK